MSFPKKCIIVDIGQERTKIADVIISKKNVKVLNSLMIKTPEGVVEDGVILDVKQLKEVFKKALVQLRTKTKNVVFTISSSKIITREVNLPDLPYKKLKSIVEMNAAEYFPVNLDEYIIDFTVIEKVEVEGEKSSVVSIIAALSTLVNEYAVLAFECQLNLAGIDYAGNSLGNLIEKEQLEGANIILDIGSISSMVTIIENGIVKFSRNQMFGTKLVIEAIVDNFDVNYEEAILISKERPLLNVDEENPYLRNDVSEAMHEVFNGISRLVDYYTSRNEVLFEKIILIGGGATIYGIEEYIQNYFSIDTVVMDSFKAVHPGSDSEFVKSQVFYPNLIGASFSDVNLVPKRISKQSENKYHMRIIFLLLALILVGMGAISYTKIRNIDKLKAEKAALEAKLDESRIVIDIKAEWTELSELVDFRRDLIVSTGNISEKMNVILEGMEANLPDGVYVKSLNDSGESLTLECIAKDKMTVAKLIESMKNLEEFRFTEVYVPSVSMQEVQLSEEEITNIDGDVTDTTYYQFSLILTY